jgi:hypothetical protein
MLLDMTKAHYANDNHDTWISLAAATARLLKTTEEQKEDRSGQPNAGRTDETKARDHREAVDHGLRNLAKWEQRIRDGRMRVKRR